MKQRRRLKSIWILLVVLFLGAAVPAVAQKPFRLRGRIERTGDEKKSYPASYVRVTLSPRAIKTRLLGVYTGADGMFYFYVSPGNYTLQVLGSDGKPVASYYVKVINKNVDLAPIVLP